MMNRKLPQSTLRSELDWIVMVVLAVVVSITLFALNGKGTSQEVLVKAEPASTTLTVDSPSE